MKKGRSIMENRESIDEINLILEELGISRKYRGFEQLSYAVCLAVQNTERLVYVTRYIYPKVAEHFNTTWCCVERNIRSVISKIWQQNQNVISEISGYKVVEKPKAAQLISIITYYYLNNKAK